MQLVFDVGATNTRVALIDNGRLGPIRHAKTDASRDGLVTLLAILTDASTGHTIEAIAGGFPGQLLGSDGQVISTGNLKLWLGLKVRKAIKELFGCPVYVTNDVALCGLGEAHFGAGFTTGLMAYYTVSTGVNAIRISKGMFDTPPNRYEMGYQVISHLPDGAPVSLEALVGGASLEKRLGVPPSEVRDPEVWLGLEKYLAAGLYNTMLYWGPELMVLGGKMMRDLDMERIELHMQKMPKVFEAWPKLKLATLGDESGIRGAAAWLGQMERR